MSNFFAALDDSGDEAVIPKKTVAKKNDNKSSKGTSIAEASKPDRRQKHDDRNTKTGRGRPHVRDGKRQYDRRSGTGRGREIKKGGGGGRNWGSDANEMRRGRGGGGGGDGYGKSDGNNDADNEKENEEKDNADDDNEGAETEEQPKDEDAAEEVEEEEDKTITYDEYVRLKKEKEESELLAPIVPTKELENEFEGVKVSVQKDEESFTAGKSKNMRKKGGNSNKKVNSNITPSFRVGERPGYGGRQNDRNGRDGYRGRGGRGRGNRRDYGGRGGRGGRKDDSKANDFSVTDEAFPSL